MAEVKRLEASTGKVKTLTVDAAAFGARTSRGALREAVVMYAARRRVGTVDTQERSDVHASNRKPWRQKGTGRARAGSRRSPLWRGGGTTFGPHPRDFGYALPRAERRVALRTALAAKLRDGEMAVVDRLAFDRPSAKEFRRLLERLELPQNVLVVPDGPDANLVKSVRNFPQAAVRQVEDLNAYEVCLHRRLLLTDAALARLRERLAS